MNLILKIAFNENNLLNSTDNNLNGSDGDDTLTGNADNDQSIYDTNAIFTIDAAGLDRIPKVQVVVVVIYFIIRMAMLSI